MADNKDTKYVPKCRIVLGTQEEATALNNGGATQIVVNKLEKKSVRTEEIKNEDNEPEEWFLPLKWIKIESQNFFWRYIWRYILRTKTGTPVNTGPVGHCSIDSLSAIF